MFPKCFKCSNDLSLSWFLGAFMWTKHRCVNCCALYEFTNWHRLSGVLIVVAIIFISPIFEPIISSSGIRGLLISAIVIAIIAIIPGQHRLSENDDLDAK